MAGGADGRVMDGGAGAHLDWEAPQPNLAKIQVFRPKT